MSSRPTRPSSRQRELEFETKSPLLRILLTEATRRGWTLARLAEALDLTYGRLSQYKRGDADVANATRATLERAAVFLGIPLAGVYVLAGRLTPADFIWPGRDALQVRLKHDLAQLRLDPLYAAFATDELMRADPRVQYLVALLYREVASTSTPTSRLPEWLRALQLASVSNAAAEAALAALREQERDSRSVL